MTTMIDDVWLSVRINVKRYRKMEETEDRDGIAKFLYDRFSERYIAPLRSVPPWDQNGFAVMALCCLMIEGLEAFRQGWPSTDGLSEEAFKKFFIREERFKMFRGYEHAFWKSVRCGILHQGESSSGWRIHWNQFEPIFDPSTLVVNATKFSDELAAVLQEYRNLLCKTPWHYEDWRNVRKKMEATIQDCKRNSNV